MFLIFFKNGIEILEMKMKDDLSGVIIECYYKKHGIDINTSSITVTENKISFTCYPLNIQVSWFFFSELTSNAHTEIYRILIIK